MVLPAKNTTLFSVHRLASQDGLSNPSIWFDQLVKQQMDQPPTLSVKDQQSAYPPENEESSPNLSISSHYCEQLTPRIADNNWILFYTTTHKKNK